jgi:hypothetical protein
MRLYGLFAALVVLLGCALGLMAHPHVREIPVSPAQVMSSAYDDLRPGVTPVVQLPKLGFNTKEATRLSYLGMIEQFMPGDSFDFDALDPAVRDCLQARDRCGAFIFPLKDRPGTRALVLTEAGRVAYKSLSDKNLTSSAARARTSAR